MVVLEVEHKDLRQFIRKHHEANIPLFIWGTTGIGKSESVREVAKEIAEKEGREFIEWNEVPYQKKLEIAKNLDKYFFLMDIRLSQLDPSDLRGLPDLHSQPMSDGSKVVNWRIPFWLYIASQENAHGFIFLDELNLAPPSIQAAAYQLILEGTLGEQKLSEHVSKFAAGNRIEDMAHVYEMSKPLQNRFDHVTLKIPSIEDWTTWGIKNQIDDRIILFLNRRPELLMGKLSKKSNDMAFPTPRSWGKYCSRLIKDVKDLDLVEKLASSAVGRGAAMEFTSFIKFQRQINLDEILKNPEKAKAIEELDLKYSLMGLVVEWYNSHYSKNDLDKVLQIANNLEPEFGVLLLRLAKEKHSKAFKTNAPKLKSWEIFWNKNGKYFNV